MRIDRLDHAFRRQAEQFLGIDLREVRLLRPAADAAPGLPGIAGCLDAQHIWLRGAPDLASPAVRAILLHELCHVAQRRAGDRLQRRAGMAMQRHVGQTQGAPVAALEAQAHDAAARFAAGLPMPRILPATAGGPLHYGPAGHYYTAYLVSLAVGVHPAKAAEYAFFTQIADQVKELDATEAGEDFVFFSVLPSTMISDLEVGYGLHSLTGRSSARETEVRAKIVSENLTDAFVCGLAIHAFGDSFAHRRKGNEKVMYRAPIGHAVEALKFNDPHSPDYLEQRKDLYLEYVSGLYAALSPAGGGGGMALGKVQELLGGCANFTGDSAQASYMRGLAAGAFGTQLIPYQPEKEDLLSYDAFAKKYQPMMAGNRSHARAMGLARVWTHASA